MYGSEVHKSMLYRHKQVCDEIETDFYREIDVRTKFGTSRYLKDDNSPLLKSICAAIPSVLVLIHKINLYLVVRKILYAFIFT